MREGDTVLDLCAGHQSMEEAAAQAGARYVAVDRVAKCKRSKKVREGWAAVAIVCNCVQRQDVMLQEDSGR